jgi:hypothetical protein
MQLKQNLDALFTGHEQGLTLISEPIDLASVLFSKTGKIEVVTIAPEVKTIKL